MSTSFVTRKGVGIDACRGGWFAVALGPAGILEFGVFAGIRDVWKTLSDADLFLIDIPIGLSEDGVRECDVLARKMLGRRAVSVFTPPCREALSARTYRTASSANLKRSGRRLTIQTWNIMPKIAEVDRFLRKAAAAQAGFRESHPEVCFASLAARPMNFAKKDKNGFAERLAVLNSIASESGVLVEEALNRHPRGLFGRDDIVDALVLALSAAMPPERLASLPALPPTDAHGLPMEIVYPQCPIK